MICKFWLFAGQCKSTADQRKLLYIFESKVAICVGGWIKVRVRIIFSVNVTNQV